MGTITQREGLTSRADSEGRGAVQDLGIGKELKAIVSLERLVIQHVLAYLIRTTGGQGQRRTLSPPSPVGSKSKSSRKMKTRTTRRWYVRELGMVSVSF